MVDGTLSVVEPISTGLVLLLLEGDEEPIELWGDDFDRVLEVFPELFARHGSVACRASVSAVLDEHGSVLVDLGRRE